MLYALILGSGHMLPPVEREDVLGFYEEFKRLLVTDIDGEGQLAGAASGRATAEGDQAIGSCGGADEGDGGGAARAAWGAFR